MSSGPTPPTIPPPGAGTPGGGQPPPVAAGSDEDATSSPGLGIHPPNAGSVPQPVKATGREAHAIDVVRACIMALRQEAIPHITDRNFLSAVMESVTKLLKYVPVGDDKDHQTATTQKIAQAIAMRRAAAGGQGPGGPPPAGGRPPGMQQMPQPGPGAAPGMTPPPGD